MFRIVGMKGLYLLIALGLGILIMRRSSNKMKKLRTASALRAPQRTHRLDDSARASELIDLAKRALIEADHHNVQYRDANGSMIAVTKQGLTTLILELEHDPSAINERALRAMQDLGISAVKGYDQSPLGDAILAVCEQLFEHVAGYRALRPLGKEFGKGEPI